MAQSIGDMEEGSSRTISVFSSAHKESLYRGHDLSSKGSFEIEDWDNDPANPYNWSTRRKVQQVVAVSFATFTTSVAVSILIFSHPELIKEFGVSSTVAILPTSLYTFALGLGPVVGGPLSETVGRYPVYAGMMLLGTLFTMGAGFSPTFAGLCILRFLAGFCFAPTLAIFVGTINETFRPAQRASPASLCILMPFLGPALGPVIGGFVTNRKGWRWTMWTIVFFAIATLISLGLSGETFKPVIQRRQAKELERELSRPPPLSSRIRLFATISLIRPMHMLVAEPIVSFICMYVACEFATLFTFFAAIPLIFQDEYHMSLEVSGLIFLGIAVGCLLGVVTVMLCNIFFYLPRIAKYPGQQVAPEHRLYPALIGSVGMPVGLFWFGWTARSDISWASPTVAIMVFAWGNLCIFVSTTLYIQDVYRGITVASAMSANSLARYGLAAASPLFTVQMYTKLGTGWASSLLGFIAVSMLPIPWVFLKYGKKIRSWSKYETAEDPQVE